MQFKNEVLQSLLKEIDLRKNYLQGEIIETIYLGGGTPSLLSKQELASLLEKVADNFQLTSNIECTIEANPDDISKEKINAFKEVGINRLSIGVQSFFDEDLHYMNRSHDAQQAERCITIAKEGGIENMSIDLIFGYPILSDEKLMNNIETLLKYKVPHISCYAMTVEPKTALASFITAKKELPINTTQSARQFQFVMKVLQDAGYEQYEISNYALPGKRALHNSNYWKGVPYLGIGPSAHSFDGGSRQWNKANNADYIRSLLKNEIPFEKETLSETQKINERIMTALRTVEGLSIELMNQKLNPSALLIWEKTIQQLIEKGLLFKENDFIKLTTEGKLFADHVAGELFIV